MQVPQCAPVYEPTYLMWVAKAFCAYITFIAAFLFYLAKSASTTHKEPL